MYGTTWWTITCHRAATRKRFADPMLRECSADVNDDREWWTPRTPLRNATRAFLYNWCAHPVTDQMTCLNEAGLDAHFRNATNSISASKLYTNSGFHDAGMSWRQLDDLPKRGRSKSHLRDATKAFLTKAVRSNWCHDVLRMHHMDGPIYN